MGWSVRTPRTPTPSGATLHSGQTGQGGGPYCDMGRRSPGRLEGRGGGIAPNGLAPYPAATATGLTKRGARGFLNHRDAHSSQPAYEPGIP